MKCHACKVPMALDRFGHPVHNGLCPGYPVKATRPKVACEHCGHEITASNLNHHQQTCTAENPKGPCPQSSRYRTCARCKCNHTPVCPPLAAVWPLDALADILGSEGLQATCKRLGVSGESFARWKLLGVPDNAADRLAVAAGYHPASIWPGWFDAGLTGVDAAKASGRAWRHMWLADEAARNETNSDQEAAA